MPPRLRSAPSVSVCIPCKNEANTIASIVAAIRDSLIDVEKPIVNELIVMDDASADETAARASEAGATVVSVDSVLASEPVRRGKGNVLWRSIAAARGDLIVWVDGDLQSFDPNDIIRLAQPMIDDPDVALVKGNYARVPDADGLGGGRNTELVARPLLALLFPELADIRQPLGGEYAVRRSAVEHVPFPQGYGVEVGLLIDLAKRFGRAAIAQVDLGTRLHRHRSLHDLSAQSIEIMHAALVRAGWNTDEVDVPAVFPPPSLIDAQAGRIPLTIRVEDCPPLLTVAEYVTAREALSRS